MKKERFIKMTAFAAAVCISAGALMTLGIGAAPTAIDEEYKETVISPRTASAEESNTARAIPAGTTRTGVNINGRNVLSGKVLIIDGVTYVPMFKFADWLGVFTYSQSEKSYVTTASISGKNLQISATENSLYIIANGRYFYTVGAVREIYGEVYVPIEPLVKALNSRAAKASSGIYSVSSGDTRNLRTAAQTYREDEVLWLSRIISAEAKGESMQGKIAVGNVVLNRTRSSQFPSTIYSVIFDKKYGVQFAPTENGAIYAAPTTESIIAAKICLEGYSVSNKILYFFNPKHASGAWVRANREYAFTLGNHVFYN